MNIFIVWIWFGWLCLRGSPTGTSGGAVITLEHPDMLYTYVIRLQSKTSLYRVLLMTKVYMNAGKTEINIFKSQSRSFNPHDIKQINAVEQNN